MKRQNGNAIMTDGLSVEESDSIYTSELNSKDSIYAWANLVLSYSTTHS